MKIIHTSDWHFGMRIGTENYQDCQEYFLKQLYDLIRRENVGAVLCAGDVYDSGNVGADAISLFDRAAQTICGELGVPFIVIAGNHDSPERLAAHRGLLSGAGLYISGRLERDIRPVLLDEGKVAVYPVPFFNRYEVQALFPERQEDVHSLQDAHKVVLDHIRETMDPDRRNIVVSHAYIVGAALSESDRAAMKGLAPAVSNDVFQGFDYAALGHIHKPQQVAPNARYSGTPVKYSFSEENHEKGVVLIDTKDMGHAFVPLPLLRDRKTAEGTFAELMARTDLADHYLRLRVTDRYSGLETYAELKERFPFLLELTGMKAAGSEGESSLTMEELETLSDEDVLIKFLAERFDYTPTDDQLTMFREAMAQVEEA